MNAHVQAEHAAEFDAYAERYAAGMEHPVKAMLGESADEFIRVKVDWLARTFPDLPADPTLKLLDYGCGTGSLLRVLRSRGWKSDIFGSDISGNMLQGARALWPAELGPMPALALQHGVETPFASQSFDVVVLCSVLHHVPLRERDAVAVEVCRVLRPGGRIVVFEHNPRNPVTRHVVARTSIDRNAVLLDERETRRILGAGGFDVQASRYLMFGPPRLPWLRRLDDTVGWFPLGAQYAVVARRSQGS